MDKREFPGVKALARKTFFRLFCVTVDGVSKNRVANISHVYANLMGPPGFKPAAEVGITVIPGNYFIMSHGAPGIFRAGGHFFSVGRMPADRHVNRSGVITDEQLTTLVKYIKTRKNVVLKGVFSHEGHSYKASDAKNCKEVAEESYRRTLRAADMIRDLGVEIDTISIGATPSIMNGAFIKGITELRLGTYIFMDAGQANAIQDFSQCAATVLATVISKPTDERVVLDAGAKALVSQNRDSGICSTNGFGYVKNSNGVRIAGLFDEHGLIYDKNFREKIQLGDKIEVIPSHVCPTVNLYDKAYFVSRGQILEEHPILCRGKSQ